MSIFCGILIGALSSFMTYVCIIILLPKLSRNVWLGFFLWIPLACSPVFSGLWLTTVCDRHFLKLATSDQRMKIIIPWLVVTLVTTFLCISKSEKLKKESKCKHEDSKPILESKLVNVDKAFVPQGIKLIEKDGVIILRRKWYKPIAWFFLAYPIIMLLAIWFTRNHSMHGVKLFHLFHVVFIVQIAVSIILIYFALSFFLNVTDIILTQGKIQISTHPIPWGGNKVLLGSDIKKISVYEKNIKGKFLYKLRYSDVSDNERDFLKALVTIEQAEYIRSCIAQFYAMNSESIDSKVN